MALVEWADNIAISGEAPLVYWPAQVAAKQITPDRLAQQRYWHALPDGKIAYDDEVYDTPSAAAVAARNASANG
jgi:hypothetical protein